MRARPVSRTPSGVLCWASFTLVAVVVITGCGDEPTVRIGKIYDLKIEDPQGNASEIREFLDDTDGDVRATALFALATLPVPDAVELSLDALDDPEPFVRMTAATLLGDLGDAAGTVPLVRLLLHDEDALVRRRAAEALAKIGGPEASAALGEALADPLKEVRLAAVQGVRKLDPSAAVESLRVIVRDDAEWEIRVHAARALGDTATPEVEADLVAAAANDENEFVRAAAAHAITRLREDLGAENQGGPEPGERPPS